MSKHAAITIISKNYFAYAQTLAESYKRNHPDHDFIVVLVDKADGYVPSRLACGADVVEIAAFQVPDLAQMIYRYSIMELNTAVKPFVLADLFRRERYDTLLYIDPDIWIFEPLREVYDALTRSSIVLTPHMRSPYHDDAFPSDTAILQSGTYNLGFIGLRRGETSRRLLDWWMAKLYRDCVVDIPNGLFVDQKWIDLVPGFFPDHEILYHPGYNAAYWNLHERRITFENNCWKADERPLVFFHFSGYVPYSPDQLSKHQNRHTLADLPALKSLTDAYSAALQSHGYDDSSRWPYAFETLSNGVRLPLDLVTTAMQWASRHAVPTPCPVTDPNRFCAFLMSRGRIPERPGAVLVLDFLLQARKDVAAAFPGCADDHDHPDFRAWLHTSGCEEHRFADLLAFESVDDEFDHVADLFAKVRLEASGLPLERFPALWTDPAEMEAFIAWAGSEGGQDAGLGQQHAEHLKAALPGVERILHLYFLRKDLQNEFADLHDEQVRAGFGQWLRRHRYRLDLCAEHVSLFLEFASACATLIARATFLYQHGGRRRHNEPSIYAVESRRQEVGSPLDTSALARWLAQEPAVSALDHFGMHFGRNARLPNDFAALTVPGLDSKANYEFVKRVRQQAEHATNLEEFVNMAGFVTAPTGMGESARSLSTTLMQAGVATRAFTLPHVLSQGQRLPQLPAMFGWPASNARLSIAVANADCADLLESFLPASFWGERRVGYWVWETEHLPARFRRAQQLFDEIWTPSAYSAEAIRSTVQKPVYVLPHTVDLKAIDAACADRRRFGLPEDALLFGFAFDPASVLERKNVLGLVEAFDEAFRADDNCYLVLKINASGRRSYEFQEVLARIDGGRVLLLEGVLDRDATFALMKSLDAYVSLHRAEGFGLTCAEAMACGIPVVASRYSGNLEFMSTDNSLLVPTRVIETERPFGPYPAGTRWGEPDRDAAVTALRQLLAEDRRRHWGRQGQADVRRTLNPSVVAQRLLQLLAPATASRQADPACV